MASDVTFDAEESENPSPLMSAAEGVSLSHVAMSPKSRPNFPSEGPGGKKRGKRRRKRKKKGRGAHSAPIPGKGLGEGTSWWGGRWAATTRLLPCFSSN